MMQLGENWQPVEAVDGASWKRRMEFAGFGEDDISRLRALHPVAEDYVDEVIEELYRRFMAFEETRRYFGDPNKLGRVKSLQREYFLDLTRGEYGPHYLANRINIGLVHRQINLTPQWYMGAYSVYMDLTFGHVMKAFEGNQEEAHATYRSLLKLMMLDAEVALTAYLRPAEEASMQSREILEASTPIVQVWKGILLIPFIGTLDTMRMQRVSEDLLQRIVDTASPVAILDITGVPTVDSHTARHLIELITAVKLLGAQVILTGLRPAIAQTMVYIGVDLSVGVTRSSLESGLRYALELLEREEGSQIELFK